MALNARQITRKAWLESAIGKIEMALDGTLDSQAQQMTFNGRSITRFTPDELDKLRRRYDAELTKLEKIESGTRSRTVRVCG